MPSTKCPACDAFAKVIARLDHAIFFLDRNGNVLHANAAGVAMLSSGHGLSLVNRQLVARDAPVAQQLADLMTGAVPVATEGIATISIPQAAPRRPLIGSVIACGAAASEAVPAARIVLLITDPDADLHAGVTAVARAFHLTPTEAQVVSLFIRRSRLEDVAEELRLRPSTVRTHLKHAMVKTGTTKQSDLVRVLVAARPPLR